MKKEKSRRKLRRFPDCSSKKKVGDSKSQKESILEVKRRIVCFPQEYVKSHKIFPKLGIKIALPFKYSNIRQKLYYKAKKENRRTDKIYTVITTLDQPFKSC